MNGTVYVAVKAIIKLNDKFLILKSSVGNSIIWDLPGGKVEYSENPYSTLTREIMEETRLEVDIIQPLGMFWFFRKKDGAQVVCNTFLCSPKNTKVDIGQNPRAENISAYNWITKEEYMNLNIGEANPGLTEIINKL